MSAKKLQLTPWHNGNVRPKHIGVYERKLWKNVIFSNWKNVRFSKWNGRFWIVGGCSVEHALIQRAISSIQNIPWRGIVKDKQ